MFSSIWFVLYLMDRLIHVKNDVQLSTPRGFYTTFRNLSDNSFLFSTPSTSTTSSVSSLSSSSHFKSTQPTLTITLAQGNVLDAFRLMNFHRSKMNEYLCDDFITATKIAPAVDRFLDSDAHKRNMGAKLIRDVGSNSYKTWLLRTINNDSKSEPRNSNQRQDELRFGYAEGHYKKPFYKIRGGGGNNLAHSNNYDNNVEDEDIYFGMSLPAYHVNRYKEFSSPIYQSTRNQTSVIPINLSMLQKRKHPTQLIPNENIIGVNLHDRYLNLTENYRKNFKNNVTPRDTFQRSEPSSNKETVAIYVTQNNPPSMGQEITDWTSENNLEFSNYNGWPAQSDVGDSMQRNPQIPPPDTSNNADSFGGYFYTTLPPPLMDNNAAPYTQYYPSITEGPREYTYPPYYPPSDMANGNNAPGYGYPGNNMDGTSNTVAPAPPTQFPPQYGYQAPVTSTLYGYQPPITSWPYGWVSTTTTTTQKPMVIGWMPMTTPVPTTINTPPATSTMPPMMGMIPMMPASPPSAAVPTMRPSFTPVPMVPVYGLPPSMIPKPPGMSWVPSTSTPLPYGIDYTFNPPNNQNPYFGMGNPPALAQLAEDFSNDAPPMGGEFNAAQLGGEFSAAQLSNEIPNNAALVDQFDYDSMPNSMEDSQNLQNLQDPRDNAISNILGPDAYELILTAIAFMAFGTYFMNTMLQLMQGNSPPTMMIIGNGGNTGVPAGSNFDRIRKFSSDDDLGILDDVLISIDEFRDWLYRNETT